MFTTKLRLAALPVLTVGILFAGGVFILHDSPGRAAPAPAAPKVPRELLEKRCEAAERVYRLKLEGYKSGFDSISELNGWSERLLEATLALVNKKTDQIAVLNTHLDRTQEVERIAIAYVKAGAARQSDADTASYQRIDAEIRIFQITGKIPPPPVYDKPVPIPKHLKPVKEKEDRERKRLKERLGRLRRAEEEISQRDQKEAAPAKNRKELLKQRINFAQRVFNSKWSVFKELPLIPSELFGCSERWLEAELALSEKKEAHVAALKAHLDRTREVERIFIAWAPDLVGESDVQAAAYERLNAEIRYFEAAGEAPPPPAPKALRPGDEELTPPVEHPNKPATDKRKP